MKLPVIALVIFLSGCATHTLIQDPTAKIENGPSKDSERFGVIKYSIQGWEYQIKGRREDSFRRMHALCSGKYEIVREGANVSETSYVPVGQAIVPVSSEIWFIVFRCLDQSQSPQ